MLELQSNTRDINASHSSHKMKDTFVSVYVVKGEKLSNVGMMQIVLCTIFIWRAKLSIWERQTIKWQMFTFVEWQSSVPYQYRCHTRQWGLCYSKYSRHSEHTGTHPHQSPRHGLHLTPCSHTCVFPSLRTGERMEVASGLIMSYYGISSSLLHYRLLTHVSSLECWRIIWLSKLL